MPALLRFTDAAVLALHSAAYLAANEDRLCTTGELAQALSCSAAHLAKVIQRLVRARLLTSVRGPSGGVQLARPAKEMSLLEIYEAIDGPLSKAPCLLAISACAGKCCLLGNMVLTLRHMLDSYLASTKLGALDTFRRAPA